MAKKKFRSKYAAKEHAHALGRKVTAPVERATKSSDKHHKIPEEFFEKPTPQKDFKPAQRQQNSSSAPAPNAHLSDITASAAQAHANATRRVMEGHYASGRRLRA